MRIHVDRDRCEGLGMCEAMAHEFFELREDEGGDDVMHLRDETPAEEHRGQVAAAVASCPVLALSLTD
ncbi:ferredoxin [Nocardioides ginsengisegetis]|uniref:Ferredoxin n=1 Tax=Nocardioides ginsengisegetis TaxID=661491 RepID=A0A7W3J3H5_9ACTN|nr:ferredoxin [Nocardioides ginsengisegetis]MBA8805564.1 ferredoxin [Nocardioides ginsengisegetis]MBA8805611.1 ferredoxin [Nocardioides ginsengisegetis]